VRIKIERSGGFAGLSTKKELTQNNLPSNVSNLIKSITQSKINSTKKKIPRGAADHYNYKITIQDGKKNHVIECNQFSIDNKLKSLIAYVEKNSKSN
jgi:hypothetical protein